LVYGPDREPELLQGPRLSDHEEKEICPSYLYADAVTARIHSILVRLVPRSDCVAGKAGFEDNVAISKLYEQRLSVSQSYRIQNYMNERQTERMV
jgi:hypothetical protein